MLGSLFGLPIISDDKLSDFDLKLSNLSPYIIHMTEQDFDKLLSQSGLSEDEFIEKLISEGWQIGLNRRWENEYWKDEK